MEHCSRDGEPKIVKHCTLPLTAVGRVNTIVTDKCIIECVPGTLTVTATAPGVSREDIIASTGAELVFAENIAEMITE